MGVVSLVMSLELRQRIDCIPRKLSRYLRRVRKGPVAAEKPWDYGLTSVPLSKYNWDDDGNYVRVRLHLENESLTTDDAKADITPMGFHLRIRAAAAVHELKVSKLNN